MAADPVGTRVVFVCPGIGRGHPFYLDGLRQEFMSTLPRGVTVESLGVADVTSPLGKLAWWSIGFVYRRGSSPGLWSEIYSRLRRDNDYNRDRFALRLLQRTVRAKLADADPLPVVVSHPLLVATLRPHPRLYYQHGEVVTPAEAVVLGAHRVFVPTEEAASPFLAAGYDPSQVLITGLCLEPDLAARADVCFQSRMERMKRDGPLTGAFFTSGAEPAHHVEMIVHCVRSVVGQGGKALVFAARGRRLHRAIHRVRHHAEGTHGGRCTVLVFDSRAELDRRTATHFDRFDYFVAPPHERTNWALGLGLPMFLLGPDVGPFAPQNRRLLLDSGVALAVEQAGTFGQEVKQLRRQGRLADMARRGIGVHATLGFAQAARFLARDVAPQARTPLNHPGG